MTTAVAILLPYSVLDRSTRWGGAGKPSLSPLGHSFAKLSVGSPHRGLHRIGFIIVLDQDSDEGAPIGVRMVPNPSVTC